MNLKIWAYLAIVVAVLGGIKWAHSAVYSAGFNAAVVEQEQLIQDAREQATEDARIKWQALVDAAEGQIITEEVIVEKIKQVPVIKYIEKIVETHPDCVVLPDLSIVFNHQISAGRSGEVDSPGVPAEHDTTLP